MKDYVKRMIDEHKALSIKIQKLHEFIYDNDGLNVHTDINNNKTQDDLFRNMTEYANKCIQLRMMKEYVNALECRLNNNGITFTEDGEYLEKVDDICLCSTKCINNPAAHDGHYINNN